MCTGALLFNSQHSMIPKNCPEWPQSTPECALPDTGKEKLHFTLTQSLYIFFSFCQIFFIFYPFHFLFDFNFFFFFGKEATDGSIFVWVFILRNADGRFCWIQKSRLECFIQYLNILSYFPRGSLLCLLRLFHPRWGLASHFFSSFSFCFNLLSL